MKKLNLMITMLILLGGCTGAGIRTEHLPGADFSSYTKFGWYENSAAYPAEQFDVRIRKAIVSDLADKGLTHAASEPQLKVAYFTLSMDKVSRVSSTVGYGYWRGSGQPTVDYYKDGSLVIELIDAETNNIVWQGWARIDVTDLEDSEALIQKTVTQILDQYPPTNN